MKRLLFVLIFSAFLVVHVVQAQEPEPPIVQFFKCKTTEDLVNVADLFGKTKINKMTGKMYNFLSNQRPVTGNALDDSIGYFFTDDPPGNGNGRLFLMLLFLEDRGVCISMIGAAYTSYKTPKEFFEMRQVGLKIMEIAEDVLKKAEKQESKDK